MNLVEQYIISFAKEIEAHSGFITALATVVIAIFTATLWKATSGMLRAAAEQSKSIEASIREAARSADAMENVAKNQEDAIEMQMRAYLTVVIGSGAYQEREKECKFAVVPLIINTGHTPAHDVTFRISADILPFPLPADFTFPNPQGIKGGSIIGPHQNVTISGIVKDFVNDDEVEAIKFLKKSKGLYVWGIVNYIDVFGKKRETEFAQIIYWLFDGKTVAGNYIPKHNRAT